MSRIKEILIEPTKIYTTNFFRIKVLASEYATFGGLKNIKVENLKDYTVKELRGED